MCNPMLNSPSLTVSREALRDAMARAGYGPSVIADAELALVELVVNAWRHGRTATPVVLVVIVGGTLRVTVADRSSALPEQREPVGLAENGRGLQLVEGLTHRWGAEPQGLGKRVWFELDGVA
ncbi:ATP-binding protein [Streptomyces sp. SP17BM10]|uniref:ATP-binding protein n=1 Tax=Streptomyces sp. SP17BM10 TaxID=3002530 RepID=UPI002E79AA58|nr:ATP-binding protein [Streptomyces sp. SP17BM10]MEE1789061.1 ATP-binding protein [Streptomyces sp. SP17BM10]